MVKSDDSALPVRATSLKGISKMYGLGKSTLRKAINEGRLRAVRIGRRTVIRIDDAEAFIASGQEIPPAPHGSSTARPHKRPKR
jgi:excisionase family DNA binding protein